MLRLPFIVMFVAVLAVVGGSSACSGGNDAEPISTPRPGEGTVASTPSAATDQFTADSAIGAVPRLASVRSMVEAYNVIVLGTVQPGLELYYRDVYPGNPCPLPYTIYSVSVDEVVYASDPSLPDELPVAIQTGPEKGSCDRFDSAQSKPLKEDTQFLLLLFDFRQLGIPGYDGDRFEVTNDGLVVPNGTEAFNPGPADLTGVSSDEATTAKTDAELQELARVTIEQATAKILAAINEGPLPAIPLWLQPYTSPTPIAEPAPQATGEPGPAATPTATPAAPSLSPAPDSQ